MKLSRIFGAFILTSVILSSCSSFHRCEAYTYHEDPVQKKEVKKVEDQKMLVAEDEITYPAV